MSARWLLAIAGTLVALGFVLILPHQGYPPPPRALLYALGFLTVATVAGIFYVERRSRRRRL